MDAYRAAGVRLYALSYDEPDALADYAEAHDTTFTLLSDPDSEVITSFGILNTLIPPDDHPWYGLPFPGVVRRGRRRDRCGEVLRAQLRNSFRS